MTAPALSNIKQAIAGGFERAYAYLISSDGYVLGQSSTLTPGATCGQPYRIPGPKTANIAIPKPDVQYAVSDVVDGALMFPAATLPNWELGADQVALDFNAIIQKIANYLEGNVLMGMLQPTDFNLADMALILQRRAKAKGGSIEGNSAWEGVIIPKVNMYPTGSTGMTARQIAAYSYWCIANPTSILPNGLDIPTQYSDTTTAPIIPFTSPNKIIYIPWIATGAVTVFNLPKSVCKLVDNTLDDGSPANGGRNTVTNEGVRVTSGLTIDITSDPQTFTFSVAPLVSHRIVLRAEIQ